jgi:predicted nucleotidyltransferase
MSSGRLKTTMEIQVEKLPLVLRKKGLEEKLGEICRSNNVVFLAIFGSFVRGEQHKGSDVDIAIEFDKSKSKTLLDLIGLEEGLSTVFKRKVDLGVFSSLNPLIVEDVKKEMLVIYQNTS